MTVGNITCGFAAIVSVVLSLGVNDPFSQAAYFSLAAGSIFLAMMFDALDGRLARLTGATSDFGAELDSLADVMTFGMAPALLVRMMSSPWRLPGWIDTMLCMAFVVCAAMRLARFNVKTAPDEESHHHFEGLPTTAAAGSVASLVILHNALVLDCGIETIAQLLPFVTLILGGLLVSKVHYIHVFNVVLKGQRSRDYLIEIIFLGALAALTKAYFLAAIFDVCAISGIVVSLRRWLVATL